MKKKFRIDELVGWMVFVHVKYAIYPAKIRAKHLSLSLSHLCKCFFPTSILNLLESSTSIHVWNIYFFFL